MASVKQGVVAQSTHDEIVDDARGLTKVYWPASEKEDFAREARRHHQRESEYARFILQARKEPMLFLQLCRLRDPAFAAGLMGNPSDAGRVAELEKRALEQAHEIETLTRERAELESRNELLERRVADLTTRTEKLASEAMQLAQMQHENRERATTAGVPFATASTPYLGVVKVLSVSPKLRRKDLEERLAQEAGITPEEASALVSQASRAGVIAKQTDGRYKLARAAEDDAE